MTDDELELKFPEISWRNAVRITVPEVGWGYACRFCIAHYGFSATDVDRLYKTEEEFRAHQAAYHPR